MRILLVAISCMLILASCDKSRGHRGVSEDIKESKKRGVFAREYTVPQNPFIINDSLQIFVEEAWLEYRWGYGDRGSTIESPSGGYQLNVNSRDVDLMGFPFQWHIGAFPRSSWRSSSHSSMMIDLDRIPSDTLRYPVYTGRHAPDTVLLGEFVLIAL